MGETREQRIVRNNATFRAANEKIHAKADEYNARLERIPFLCECPRPDCVEILRLTPDEYKKVRANPAHFFTVSGHEDAEAPVGRVVSERDRYVIIEKS
jgi:hypothetical protein